MIKLEPRFEQAGVTILNELEEVTEVVMFVDGKIDVGFEMNGKRHFVVRYINSSSDDPMTKSYGKAIGDHGCTFNKASRFIYKTASYC